MPSINDLPQVRVVVRLPYNRPDHPPDEPPTIEWTTKKADTLWKVVERQLMNDGQATDWNALAQQLDVPLPYLLFRAQASLKEGLRGISKIPGITTPSTSPSAGKEFPFDADPPTVAGRAASRLGGSIRSGSSGRNSTPLGIRARLSSLGANSPRPKRASSSSTLTLQAPPSVLRPGPSLRPPTPSSSEHSSSSDSEAEEDQQREEEARGRHEEQQDWESNLRELQRRMNPDALGLVSSGSSPLSTRNVEGRRSHSMRSESQSLSSVTSSAHNSIPEIPSPPAAGRSHSRRTSMSPTHPSSPPPFPIRNTVSQKQFPHLVARSGSSENSSGPTSQASSFSDIGSDASMSGLESNLESALITNVIRGGTSRLRSRAMGVDSFEEVSLNRR
ncbi:hypothetical protein CYLTODRAFT_488171 [Cylindrobasidium torrendii FP15055 ss-10]|uniref:Atg29 N-terminal domain-containing protein n=1 Tax=Cylindrobasidium torrendii FP15055 ss-10 TaxID=1314674 RepID=A0A0D7BIU5_9AGAR|nr:hypothetical protein CYLTODRAFT_488171 [Cylindrobasidium torrendii FP15055 ss-10]